MSRRRRRAREKQLRHPSASATVRPRAFATGSGLAIAATLVSGSVAHAASTFEVDNTGDGALSTCSAVANDCSLRGAISAANADPGSTITFASYVTGSITLGSTLPAITAPTTITGPGAKVLAIDAGDIGFKELVVDGSAGAVSISGLKVTGDGNSTAIYNKAGDTLTLTGVAVSDNAGQAIYSAGPLKLDSSTVSGNGRGVFAGDVMTVTDSTVADNDLWGIDANHGTPVTIENSTFAGNRYGVDTTGPLEIYSSVFANDQNDVRLFNGTATLKENYSLIKSPPAQALEAGSGNNLNGQDSQLGALADNGGQTETMKPAGTSPVVDQGKDYVGSGLDQRGLAISDGAPANAADGRDIGAVELQIPQVSSLSDTSGNAGDPITITGKNFTGATAVTFGSRDAASFTVVNDTTITTTVPGGNNGPVDVTVTTPEGTSPASSADQFTYPTFVVDTTSDSGSLTACTPAPADCSLRGAIAGAEASAGSTITFASGVTGTITPASALPYLSAGETIEGPGADLLAINAGGIDRILTVDSGTAVSISGLTINTGSSVSTTGILHNGSGALSLSGDALSGNIPVYSRGGDLTVSDSTISQGNLAIWKRVGGALTVENSTLYGNSTNGVRTEVGATIRNSTITGSYRGLSVYGGQVDLESTIVAGNQHDGVFSGSSTLHESYSLIQKTAYLPAGFDAGHNLNGQDPQLGPLADHGGPTKTMAPAFSSPVVDRGKDFTGTGKDQRGVAIADQPGVDDAADGRDIGALELRLPPAIASLAPDHGNAGATVTITGSHFTGTTSVKFGSTEATSFTVDSDTQITATAPPGHNGPVDVTVTADSTSATNSADQFTYPTFVVDTTDDNGSLTDCTPAPNDCSLRGAVSGAQASAGSTITFASGVTGTISLGANLPAVTAGETIQGPGADVLAIDGGGQHTGFDVNTAGGSVGISGLTIKHAYGFDAGAVRVNGSSQTLRLSRMVLADNTAHYNGAVNAAASTVIENSTITGNDSTAAPTKFGAIATTGHGLTLRNSTVSGNPHGGVDASGSHLNVVTSTIASNGNGGIAAQGAGADVALFSAIVAGNTGSDVSLAAGDTLTENFSLIQNDTGLTPTGSANLNGQDPKLGALTDNGGPTETMKPAADSPVVDQGEDYTGTGKDQRGRDLFDRADVPNAGDGRDMGAVELEPPAIFSLSPSSGATGTEVTITGTNFTAATAVKFGTHDATSFTVMDDTTITATAPAGDRVKVDVTVTNPDGTSATSGGDQFAYPGTFEVDTTSDDDTLTACTPAADDCSLRGAITGANELPGSTITFASGVTGSITLGSNLPYVDADEKIEGPGADVLAIDGAGNFYGLHVSTSGVPASISGLTVKDTSGNYGGIYASGNGQLTLSGMVVSGNTGNYHGGISTYAPTVIENSTISGNTSEHAFGAIGMGNRPLTLRNSTVSGNPGGGLSVGNNTTTTVENSTIAANPDFGISERNRGDLRLRSSIVAGNTGPDVSVTSPGKVAENFSLVQNGAGLPALQAGSGNNLNGQDPKLGALASNGGPTQTMKPAADSPVVDKGHDYAGTGKDQRGLGIAGSDRDIGAVERQQPSVTSLSPTHAHAGDTVTIAGSGFTGATGVKFGSADATNVTVVDGTHITAKAPAGSGAVDVTVTGPDGTSATSDGDKFTYDAANPTPNPNPNPNLNPNPGPTPPPAGLSDADVLKLLKRPVLSSKFVTKKRTLVFKDRLPEAGKASYTLRVLHKRKQLKLGTAAVTATGAKTATVTIKLSKKNWSVLRLNPKGKLSLVTSFKRKLNGHTLKVTRTNKPKARPKR